MVGHPLFVLIFCEHSVYPTLRKRAKDGSPLFVWVHGIRKVTAVARVPEGVELVPRVLIQVEVWPPVLALPPVLVVLRVVADFLVAGAVLVAAVLLAAGAVLVAAELLVAGAALVAAVLLVEGAALVAAELAVAGAVPVVAVLPAEDAVLAQVVPAVLV